MLSNCTVCGKKKSRFIKKQEASGLLSKLGIKTPLSNIPLIGDILHWRICFALIIFGMISLKWIKFKILLTGGKFMPELHLRQGFTYSACKSFMKHRKRINKFKETGDLNYIYKNESDKTCFIHDVA